MYRLIIIFGILFFSNALAQNSICINFNDKGVDFTLNVRKTLYNVEDSIYTRFEINNVSNKNFFIFAHKPFKEEPYIDRENNEIYYIYGGHLSSHVGLVNTMQIVKPEDKITFDLIIKAPSICNKSSKSKMQSYKFYIYFGYLDFDRNLIYLSNSETDLVQIRKDSDTPKIIDLHHELVIGYIPITITGND